MRTTAGEVFKVYDVCPCSNRKYEALRYVEDADAHYMDSAVVKWPLLAGCLDCGRVFVFKPFAPARHYEENGVKMIQARPFGRERKETI